MPAALALFHATVLAKVAFQIAEFHGVLRRIGVEVNGDGRKESIQSPNVCQAQISR